MNQALRWLHPRSFDEVNRICNRPSVRHVSVSSRMFARLHPLQGGLGSTWVHRWSDALHERHGVQPLDADWLGGR